MARFVREVVAYYVAQAKSSNHAVREAACACIAELMEKVRFQRGMLFLLLCFRLHAPVAAG